MRGASALAIVLIIAVIAGIGFFALQYLPGGIPSVNINYKNDVIAIEDVFLSNSKPYEGTDTTLQFNVVNNGDKKVKNVILDFSTGGGFDLISKSSDLKCADANPQSTTYPATGAIEWNKCVFDEIDSLGLKHISLTLHASDVQTDTPYNIKYSVQYDYHGERIATIPIIDSSTRIRPISRFSQSTPSIGPVVLDFQAGEAREFAEGGKTVTGYWLEYGSSAEVKINLKNIGSSSIGTINDTYINEKTFTLDAKGILTPSGVCNFVVDADKSDGLLYYCRNSNPSGSGCDLDQPMRPVKLPAQLSCNFNPSQKLNAPEISATILASFDYTYKFAKTQQITVRNVNLN